MTPGKSIRNLGDDNALLLKPIVAIRGGTDGTIWIATDGSGLIGLRHNTVAYHLSKHNGLNTDRINCIAVDSGAIWAATTGELNRISLDADGSITRYSTADELSSDIIHTLLVDNGRVYAGTNNGITWPITAGRNPTYTYDARGNLAVAGWKSSSYDNKPSIFRTHPVFQFIHRNYSKNNSSVQAKYNSKGLPLAVVPGNDTFFELKNVTKAIYDCQ